MNKLKLSLEELTVESFDTTRAEPGRPGTVHGNMYCYYCCCSPCCCVQPQPTAGENTCQASCNGTCDASCNGTCACGGYTDYDCTLYDATCRNYGSCGQRICADIP